MTKQLPVVTENAPPISSGEAKRIASVAQALSDPIRVEMLAMMSAGRECCPLPQNISLDDGDTPGLCVCEFEGYFEMSQSKISYHMKKLKDANLVNEQKRGRWNYYSVNRETLAGFASTVESLTESAPEG